MKFGIALAICFVLLGVQFSYAQDDVSAPQAKRAVPRVGPELAAPSVGPESDSEPKLKRSLQEQEAFEQGCEDSNQRNLNVCTYYDFKVLDEHLNVLYKRVQLKNRSDPVAAKRLTLEQRAWLKYVNADCLYRNGPYAEGGSGWPADENNCLSEHFKARIELLELFLR